MKTKKALISKNTDRLLRSVLPTDFEMVKNQQSNGYKLVNLLFGVEVDACRLRLQEVYNNSFLDTIDLSSAHELYDVNLDYVPDEITHLNNGIIKITDEYEFYNGDPTRILIETPIVLEGNISGILGLEYLRQGPRGSGYLVVATNNTQEDSFINSAPSTWKIYIDPLGNIQSYSGLYPGVFTQDFENTSRDEILTPITSKELYSTYPKSRTVIDSQGISHIIDHYEPYHGWTLDEDDNVIPVNDYSGTYYFDEYGDKIYYQTALNNPYGSGNYTTAYLRLENIPISGTLKIFDIDILDISGNAVEIPQNPGFKTLYHLQYSGWNIGVDGEFIPTYEGYDSIVPIGKNFGAMEGSAASGISQISWDYLCEGSSFNQDTRNFDEITNGTITNLIKITNPRSKYLVTYKYEVFKTAKYVTSLEKSRYLSLDNANVSYSVEPLNKYENLVDYNFSNDPQYQNKEVVTFDAKVVRPGSSVSKIEFNIPTLVRPIAPLTSNVSINLNQASIGYSNDYIPQVTKIGRSIWHACNFDASVTGSSVNESGDFTYDITYPNFINLIPIKSYYGKDIFYDPIAGVDSYYFYNKLGTDFSFCPNDSYFKLNFILSEPQDVTLIEAYDSTQNDKLIFTIYKSGDMRILTNGSTYGFTTKFEFGSNISEVIIKKTPISDSLTDYSDVKLYVKDGNFFTEYPLWVREETKTTISNNELILFKNSRIIAKSFKMWNEVG